MLNVFQDFFNGYSTIVEKTVNGSVTTTYIGEARDKGAATSDLLWRIKKVVETVSSGTTTTTIQWAGGLSYCNAFGYAWDSRASLTYK